MFDDDYPFSRYVIAIKLYIFKVYLSARDISWNICRQAMAPPGIWWVGLAMQLLKPDDGHMKVTMLLIIIKLFPWLLYVFEHVQNKKLELQGKNLQRHSPLRLDFKGLIISSHENSVQHVNIENEQRNQICCAETSLHGQRHRITFITRNEERPTCGCYP